MKPACLATCEDSPTIIIGVARTWAWRKTRPSDALSKDRKLGGSFRSQRWAGFIIGTNVALPEPRRCRVESQPQQLGEILITGDSPFRSGAAASPATTPAVAGRATWLWIALQHPHFSRLNSRATGCRATVAAPAPECLA